MKLFFIVVFLFIACSTVFSAKNNCNVRRFSEEVQQSCSTECESLDNQECMSALKSLRSQIETCKCDERCQDVLVTASEHLMQCEEAEEEEANDKENEDEDDEEAEEEEEEEEEEETEEAEEAEAEEAEEATSSATAEDAEELVEIDAESNAETDIIRLAERNAAMVEQEAHRVMADSSADEAEAAATVTDEAKVAPLSLSELDAEESTDIEIEDSSDSEAEAADMLGLPAMPSTVPVEHHDDLSEVAAEVEAELHHNTAATAIAAVEPRFRQQLVDEDESQDEAEADEEDESEQSEDAEFEALMHGEDSDEAGVTAQIESELANEDAADVDVDSTDASDVDVAAIDSEMDAVTSAKDESVEGNKDVMAMRATIAALAGELNKVKAEGVAMASAEL